MRFGSDDALLIERLNERDPHWRARFGDLTAAAQYHNLAPMPPATDWAAGDLAEYYERLQATQVQGSADD